MHVFIYGVLAFLAARAFRGSSRENLRRYGHLAAFFLVFLIACIDELNQSFNPARTGSIYDVALDCAGGLLVILVLAGFAKFYKTPRQIW